MPGEDAAGVLTAIDYLHGANTGGASFSGAVAVIGGGNVAVDAARVSRRSGASAVTMYSLESEKEMPASAEELSEARADGVAVENGWGPKEVLTQDGRVTGIVLKKCVSVFDAQGRFAPVYDENECITVACSRVIFAIGQKTVWGDLLRGAAVEFRGPAVVADKLTFQTGQPDIFVGGDVLTGPKFAIDAIAAGHAAAESLHRYVRGGHMTIGRNRWEFNELDKNNIRVENYDTASRQREGVDGTVPAGSFTDAHLTFTEEQVRVETARCLGCGVSVVDENRCIGCGICTTRCAFDAITLRRDRPECTKMVPAEDKFKYILPYQMKRAVRIAKSGGK